MKNGFSLLEFLVVAAILAVIAGGLLTVLHQGQVTFQSEDEKTVATEQARIAMDLVVRYMRQAGNDPERYLELNNLDALAFNSSDKQLRARSDITGSVPSATGNPMESTGDPDGTLDSIHEDVKFQFTAGRLRMDVGYGWETIVDDVSDFGVTFYDKFGNPGAPANLALRATVELTLQDQVTLQSEVMLRRSSYDHFYRGD